MTAIFVVVPAILCVITAIFTRLFSSFRGMAYEFQPFKYKALQSFLHSFQAFMFAFNHACDYLSNCLLLFSNSLDTSGQISCVASVKNGKRLPKSGNPLPFF
jgi:hypothetical protein